MIWSEELLAFSRSSSLGEEDDFSRTKASVLDKSRRSSTEKSLRNASTYSMLLFFFWLELPKPVTAVILKIGGAVPYFKKCLFEFQYFHLFFFFKNLKFMR